MTQLRTIAAVVLMTSRLLATEYPANAAQNVASGNSKVAACTVDFRRCMNRCERVYESLRAIRTCRDRCDDQHLGCESSLQ
jgi:hypothetical protein